MKRMWINQPSKDQILHELHGTNVLADDKDTTDKLIRIYFLSGDVISQDCIKICLSDGWVNEK